MRICVQQADFIASLFDHLATHFKFQGGRDSPPKSVTKSVTKYAKPGHIHKARVRRYIISNKQLGLPAERESNYLRSCV